MAVHAERRRSRRAGPQPGDGVAVAAASVAELLLGAELGGEKARLLRQAVESLLSEAAVVSYDLGVARAHALLLAETRRVGRPRGAHDLIVAATGRTLLTADRSAPFADLPGVDVVEVR